MTHPRPSFPRVALAGVALLLFSLTVCIGSRAAASPVTMLAVKADSKWVGSYESDPPKPGAPGGSMSMSLGRDGTATVTQDPGKGEYTSFGHWSDSGSQITVTFDASGSTPAPPPMTFTSSHGGLQAVTWDHAAWGKLTPPPMKKGSDWHKGRHSAG